MSDVRLTTSDKARAAVTLRVAVAVRMRGRANPSRSTWGITVAGLGLIQPPRAADPADREIFGR